MKNCSRYLAEVERSRLHIFPTALLIPSLIFRDNTRFLNSGVIALRRRELHELYFFPQIDSRPPQDSGNLAIAQP